MHVPVMCVRQYVFQLTVSKDTRVAIAPALLRLTATSLDSSSASASSPSPIPALTVAMSVPTQGVSWTAVHVSDAIELLASSDWVTEVVNAKSGVSSGGVNITLQWRWTCVSGGVDVDVGAGSRALTSDANSRLLGLAPGSLASGMHTFTVHVTRTEIRTETSTISPSHVLGGAVVSSAQSSITFAVSALPAGGR